jgi:S1-C subfamily serine protease
VLGAAVASATTAAIMASDDDADTNTTVVARPPIVTPEGVMDIQAILDKVQESVVTIETSASTSSGVFEGSGTGVVLTADGMVLTNAHVISNSDEIQVRMFDGTTHDATLVGSAPDDDLAVIQLADVDDLVPAKLGSSDALSVGEPVIAIGNALNLGGQPTVTQGIVSATNRSIEGPVAGGGTVDLSGLIQTDAAINPGNSGGPLVDVSGEVVGINTAIADGQNIGFAIAIDGVKQLIEDLENGQGEITPDSAFLGVSTVNVDTIADSVRRELGISADEGAFVQDVQPDSAAEGAGIQAADVILEIDGKKVATSSEVAEIIGDHAAGDQISIKVQREGEDLTLNATLGRRGG